jgi:hypothetical protein
MQADEFEVRIISRQHTKFLDMEYNIISPVRNN